MSEVIFNFTGKNFLVVGASSGMGKEMATILSNNLLSLLYRDKFDRFQEILNQKGL